MVIQKIKSTMITYLSLINPRTEEPDEWERVPPFIPLLSLYRCHIPIPSISQHIRHLMKMRCKQRSTLIDHIQIPQRGKSNRNRILDRRPPAYLIHND